MNAQVEALIADKTRDFVGREYVFAAIDEFLASHSSGYFIVEGDPGAGKSAIMAELVRRTGHPSHFNVRAEGINTWAQFVENISDQVSTRLGLARVASMGQTLASADPLSELLREASMCLSSGDRLVMVIDALDEASLIGHPPGANVLFLPQTLPQGVYFVLTKRRGDLPLSLMAPQLWYALDDKRAETERDIRAYIDRAARRPLLREWLDGQAITAEAFVEVVASKSDHNFMYLRHVLPEITSGVYGDWSTATLPQGLAGYYNDHWERMGMKVAPLPRRKIRIIYVLAELQRAVSRGLIAQFASEVGTEIDEVAVQEVLDEWRQFLHEHSTPSQTLYSIYHASFQDFLHQKDVVKAAGVTIKGINAMIADELWQDLFGRN